MESQVLSTYGEDEILFCLSGSHPRATLDGCGGCALPKALDPQQVRLLSTEAQRGAFFPHPQVIL